MIAFASSAEYHAFISASSVTHFKFVFTVGFNPAILAPVSQLNAIPVLSIVCSALLTVIFNSQLGTVGVALPVAGVSGVVVDVFKIVAIFASCFISEVYVHFVVGFALIALTISFAISLGFVFHARLISSCNFSLISFTCSFLSVVSLLNCPNAVFNVVQLAISVDLAESSIVRICCTGPAHCHVTCSQNRLHFLDASHRGNASMVEPNDFNHSALSHAHPVIAPVQGIGMYVGAAVTSFPTELPNCRIGSVTVLVVSDAPSAAMTAIHSMATPKSSTMSFAMTDFSSCPSACAPMIEIENPPAFRVSISSSELVFLIPSVATRINTSPKARAAEA